MNLKLFSLIVGSFLIFTVPACKRAAPETAKPVGAKTLYRCPMHPQIIRDAPGTCPICGMTLVSFTSEASKEGASGQASVSLSTNQQQLIGVKLGKVERRDLEVLIQASARVAYDPTLYSAILEHQEAVNAARDSQAGSSYQEQAQSTVRSSRLRLRQMGLSDELIDRVSNRSFDASAFLMGKPGRAVWVYADVYDYESPLIKAGQRVELTSPAFPGQTLTGLVRSIDTVMNPETRTLRVRIETPNPNGNLKPEMYLSATLRAPLGKRLAIPADALMDTGARQLVYEEKSPGVFEPRVVRTGPRAGDYVEVLDGLSEGATIAATANFLIDSESKIRASAQGK